MTKLRSAFVLALAGLIMSGTCLAQEDESHIAAGRQDERGGGAESDRSE